MAAWLYAEFTTSHMLHNRLYSVLAFSYMNIFADIFIDKKQNDETHLRERNSRKTFRSRLIRLQVVELSQHSQDKQGWIFHVMCNSFDV